MSSARGVLTTRRVLRISSAVVLVLLLAGSLWYANRPGPAASKVGDCVSAPGGGAFTAVGCSDAKAAYRVIGSYPGLDGNACDQSPGTLLAVRTTVGATGSILCLGARK
jgi:hypothetical protein